ncbi:MAG: preprotein translocase subunit SecA [Bacilli bacterium]|nr:preprotein translocase subunit SecA [Bacilli bacterium]
MGLLKSLVDTEYKELKKFKKIADKIVALDDKYTNMSDEDLASTTDKLKAQLENGKTVNDEDIIVTAFAAAREVAYRQIGEKPYYVQLLGGLALHFGNIAELKTGEGKTLTTILPAYLNALTGKGVHVVTVNEYLTQRNADWMRPIYEFLGLSVGVNLHEMSPEEKREVYNCDITYSTNNEVGFDYLRDNMVVRKEDRVLRKLNYVILDEVDSILIDEARTPLIISGGKVNTTNLYREADKAVKSLVEEDDYTVDPKTKSVMLTEDGSKKVEKFFKLKNLYDEDNTVLVHHINQALKANYGMKLDVDYVVDGEQKIIIVDPFTGRLMQGRQFSDGLHQAIEAKEGVQINEETRTMATITFQNLFRMYAKISGMTGTAKTEEEEFRDIYNMYVIQIPTNKPCIRKDMSDIMYATEGAKFKNIVDFIKQVHETGQPILVGTISVENNERLSKMLDKVGIKHEVLNAKNHAREAEIIAKAGEKGAVTIATNMAGRGTDIKLGDGVSELGGLCVIGTERHESRRIDNQLRGRAGRQGDPGYSQFFISFEDELMHRFGADRVKNMVQSLGLDDMEQVRSKMFTKSVESAQKKVEGNNYDMRKNLLDYDNIVSEQRKIIYERRNEILDSEDIHQIIIDILNDYIDELIEAHIAPEGYLTNSDMDGICDAVNHNLLKKEKIRPEDLYGKKEDEVFAILSERVIKDYEEKIEIVPKEIVTDFEKHISLRVIDEAWVKHIADMDQLREGIGLRGYGQNNPLQAYALEGYEMFEAMQDNIDASIATFLLKMEIKQNFAARQLEGNAGDGKEKVKTTVKNESKVGRNDKCPCGSGKKYKNCCGK